MGQESLPKGISFLLSTPEVLASQSESEFFQSYLEIISFFQGIILFSVILTNTPQEMEGRKSYAMKGYH